MIDYTRLFRSLSQGRLGLSAEQLDLVRQEAVRQGISLSRAVVASGLVEEAAFLRRVAEESGTEFLELREPDIAAEAVAAASPTVVGHYRVMPVAVHNGTIRLATDDPLNEGLVEELELVLQKQVDLVLATSEAIAQAMRRHYGVGAETIEQLVSKGEGVQEEEAAGQDLDDDSAARDASVIKLVNQVLKDAIEQRATDIHYEPFEEELRVRYRIDGVLREAGVPVAARHFRHAIVSRAKIMASLDVAERRLPQDGRAQVNVEGQAYDLRISILPTPHGEALNFRILPRNRTLDDLESLGFEDPDLSGLKRLVEKPHGIILVTGPTGSGKTTTLYTVLKMLNRAETKILTIEDPIEYRMRGLVQMQANAEIGFTFGTALRSILRHDPDVILIGEIRDYETAEITIRTSLTGHLVFSTLHTNDAPTAMGRLTDMGVEPFLIASSVEGVLAQRLLRLVCPHCKEWHAPPRETLGQLGPQAEGITELARGRGCRECRFTGYLGRTCITELMVMNGPLREMVTSRRHAADIRKQAVLDGMQSLRASGIRKVMQGLTTVDEVLRVTPADDGPSDVIVGEG